MELVHRFSVTSVCGHVKLRQPLAAIAFVALVTAAIPAKADFIESVDTIDCSGNSGLIRNTATKLSASFTCASGASAQAFSDIASGKLGALATSGNLGRPTGNAFVFQAAVNNGSGNFGLTGTDGPTNVNSLQERGTQ